MAMGSTTSSSSERATVRRRPHAAHPTYPTLLFDLDGTLLDSIELILSSARYAFAKRGREYPSDEVWATGIGIPLFTMFRRYAHDDADCAEFISVYREHQFANHDRLVRSYDQAVETVRELHERGHEMAIVTSKTEYLALRGLVHVGLARYFDTIVGTEASTRHKPDPEPVQIALQRLACPPERAIFIGDSIFDLQAGNAAGVASVAAVWGASNRSELETGKPTHWLERISDLLTLATELAG
jgi:pyrophosphatase PpaX